MSDTPHRYVKYIAVKIIMQIKAFKPSPYCRKRHKKCMMSLKTKNPSP